MKNVRVAEWHLKNSQMAEVMANEKIGKYTVNIFTKIENSSSPI